MSLLLQILFIHQYWLSFLAWKVGIIYNRCFFLLILVIFILTFFLVSLSFFNLFVILVILFILFVILFILFGILFILLILIDNLRNPTLFKILLQFQINISLKTLLIKVVVEILPQNFFLFIFFHLVDQIQSLVYSGRWIFSISGEGLRCLDFCICIIQWFYWFII